MRSNFMIGVLLTLLIALPTSAYYVTGNARSWQGFITGQPVRNIGGWATAENSCPTTPIKIAARADDEYWLEFMNRQGNYYNIPLVEVSQNGKLRLGRDENRDLVFEEPPRFNEKLQEGFSTGDPKPWFPIHKKDTFVLTNRMTGNKPVVRYGYTHILEYESIDTTTQTLTFEDLALGPKETKYTLRNDNVGEFDLPVGGTNYKGYVLLQADYPLAIDLDGEGGVTGANVQIITKGEGVITLHYPDNANPQSLQLDITTPVENFNEPRNDPEIITVLITKKPDKNQVSISRVAVTGEPTLTPSGRDHLKTTTYYGVRIDQYKPTDQTIPEELTLEYPMNNQCAGRTQTEEKAFSWKGCVDGSDYINVKGNQISIEHRNWAPIGAHPGCAEFGDTNPQGSYSGDLTGCYQVKLSDIQGRGKVQLVQETPPFKVLLDDDEYTWPNIYSFKLECTSFRPILKCGDGLCQEGEERNCAVDCAPKPSPKPDPKSYFGIPYDFDLYIESEPWRGRVTWDDADTSVEYKENKIYATFEDARALPADVTISASATAKEIILVKEWFAELAAYRDPSFITLYFDKPTTVTLDGKEYSGTKITVPLWKDIHEKTDLKKVIQIGGPLVAACGNGICEPGENGFCPTCPVKGLCDCKEGSCPQDCSEQTQSKPYCGDNVCQAGENRKNCAQDCEGYHEMSQLSDGQSLVLSYYGKDYEIHATVSEKSAQFVVNGEQTPELFEKQSFTFKDGSKIVANEIRYPMVDYGFRAPISDSICGNGICEYPPEDESGCPRDCSKKTQTSSETSDHYEEITYQCAGGKVITMEDPNCRSSDEWIKFVRNACEGQCAGLQCGVSFFNKLNPCYAKTEDKTAQVDVSSGEEPEEPVSEKVTCVFQGSSQGNMCVSNKGPSCSGVGSCIVLVSGGGYSKKLGGYEKVKWESSCGSTAYTTLDGTDEKAVFNCPEKQQSEESDETTCAGCLKDDNCLPFGTRLLDGDMAKYCDITKQFVTQKAKEASCQNNYECLTNQCSEGICVNLSEELRKTQGMLQRVLSWFSRIFG